MDLGATICKANSPSCQDCPINKKCESHKRNWIDNIPAKKPKKKIPTRDVYALIVEKENHILLDKISHVMETIRMKLMVMKSLFYNYRYINLEENL